MIIKRTTVITVTIIRTRKKRRCKKDVFMKRD